MQNADDIRVPSGLELGEKIVLIPLLPKIFSIPLWRQTKHREPVITRRAPYWINRGDPVIDICFLERGNGFLSGILPSYHEASVRSPVSGLIINDGSVNLNRDDARMSLKNDCEDFYRVMVLVSKDEPEPENGEYIFGDVYRTATSLIQSLKKGFEEDGSGESEEQIMSSLEEMMTREPRLEDWRQHERQFEILRKHHTEVRSLISHLS